MKDTKEIKIYLEKMFSEMMEDLSSCVESVNELWESHKVYKEDGTYTRRADFDYHSVKAEADKMLIDSFGKLKDKEWAKDAIVNITGPTSRSDTYIQFSSRKIIEENGGKYYGSSKDLHLDVMDFDRRELSLIDKMSHYLSITPRAIYGESYFDFANGIYC